MNSLAQLFDAGSIDPTGTSRLRRAFRAFGKLQLRQLRAALRTVIIDHDLLGCSGTNIAIMAQAPDVKLGAFNHWLTAAAQKYLQSEWAQPYVTRAWQAGAAAASAEIHLDYLHPGGENTLHQLLHQELKGITAAIVQQVGRAAGRQFPSSYQAWQCLSQAFDKVAVPRISALCNSIVVAAYNRAKVAVYRQAGFTHVGIIPERIARDAAADALLVEMVTAGDNRVCQQCDDLADDSPYSLAQAEDLLPVHVDCRCSLVVWTGAIPRDTADYSPDQPRDPDGRWSGGGGTESFVSPNVGELTFAQAQHALSSDRQQQLQRVSQEIDQVLDIPSHTSHVIGAWADGAENSLMVEMHSSDPEVERAALAMKGHLADQKQVLMFRHQDDGPHAMAQFRVSGSLDTIHAQLLRDGIAFHTIEPHDGGATVHVFSDSPDGLKQVFEAAKAHGTEVTVSRGRGEFLGTQKSEGSDREQRDDARREYERVISESARTRPRIAATWNNHRDRGLSGSQQGERGGGGGPGGARSPEQAQASAAQAAVGHAKLAGLPDKPIKVGDAYYVPGPYAKAQEAAADYMRKAGLPYDPPKQYLKVDKERAGRVADAFDRMSHAPDDPAVRASYEALARETIAQWHAIRDTGLKVEWIKPGQPDPYAATPRLAAMDVVEHNHWWGFPTELGYGSGEAEQAAHNNPMLQPTGEVVDGRQLVVNDVFRIVHDYFGHFKEGVGFRADGEENAWRSHAAMYSELARGAMTAETRGQNSWVNFGPYGEANRKASAGDTHYAPQKIGLMPTWTQNEGRKDPTKDTADYSPDQPRDPEGRWSGGGSEGATSEVASAPQTETPAFKHWFGVSKVVGANGRPLVVFHGTTQVFEKFAVEKASPEGQFGSALYFTNTPGDVSVNYAGEGPDLTNKIETRAEQISAERSHPGELSTPEENYAAREQARAELMQHQGAVLPVYLKMEKPFDTSFNAAHAARQGRQTVTKGAKTDTWLDYESSYNEETEEYGEPSGTLVDFIEGVKQAASDYHDADLDDVLTKIQEEAIDGGISSSRLEQLWRSDENVSTASDDEGKLVSSEIFRRGLEHAGFDGVIDRAVSTKFANMQGLAPTSVHYLVFKPTQVKSALGNKGTFDPKSPRIVDYNPDQPRVPAGSSEGGEFAGGGGGDRGGPLVGSQGDPGLVSTALTTAKGRSKKEREQIASEAHNYQRVDLEQVRKDPDFFSRSVDTFRNGELFPYMRASDFNGEAEHDARAVVDRMKSNLHAMWKDTSQENIDKWRHWYVGAYNMVSERLQQYPQVDRASMTAMYAAQSPNTMWDVNVHYGDRLLETVYHHADDPWDKGMGDAAQMQLEKAAEDAKKKGAQAQKNLKVLRQTFDEVQKAGSFAKQSDDYHRAAWVKLWNDAHDETPVREVGIDGSMGQPIQNKGVDDNGDPSNLSGAFGPLNRIENALKALRSGGNLSQISDLLGDKHKVRSFYNNILDPHSANNDVTIDTHAGGAAWLDPLGANSPAIGQLFGSSAGKGQPGAPGSSRLGVQGSYPFYAQAYHEVAQEVGLDRSRELQSIIWEHKISLFKNAPKAKKELVRAVWQHFRDNPGVSLEQTQQRVLRIAKAGYDAAARGKRRERTKDGSEFDYYADEAGGSSFDEGELPLR